MEHGKSLIHDEGAALELWAAQVRANRDQAEAFREGTESPDFYAPVAASFAADPRREGEPTLDILRSLVQPEDVWMDIGAGGGRYALPLALLAKEVIAVEPSPGMNDVLTASAAEHGVGNVRTVPSRWPMDEPAEVDVCLMSHVGYDIEDIGPFLDVMEASARRLCVAVFLAMAPSSVAAPFWSVVHGVERDLLPAQPEFISVQLARGRMCEVRLTHRDPPRYENVEAPLAFFRQQLFIQPDGEKDVRLREELDRLAGPDGSLVLDSRPVPLGIVTWAPEN